MTPVNKASNVIIKYDGKILLLLRSVGWKTGYWGPPGGIADENEDPKDTAIREVFEETGLVIEKEDLRFLKSKTKSDFGMVWFYIVEKFTGDIELSWEHDAYKWIDIDNLEEYDITLTPEEVALIRKVSPPKSFSILINP